MKNLLFIPLLLLSLLSCNESQVLLNTNAVRVESFLELKLIPNRSFLAYTNVNIPLQFDKSDNIDIQDIHIQCLYQDTIPCSSLPGFNIDQRTKVLTWRPTDSYADIYKISIRASWNELYTIRNFDLDIQTTDIGPTLPNLSNATINRSNPNLLFDVNDDQTGLDRDADGDLITYGCFYDTTMNNFVDKAQHCSDLSPAMNFNTTTGIFNWSPTFDQIGNYEILITATSKSQTDESIFRVTVINLNRPPFLSSISDVLNARPSIAITTIDANDQYGSGGNFDLDVDGDLLTYSCTYRQTLPTLTSSAPCVGLGVVFSNTTGVFNWTPSVAQIGSFEFTITADDQDLTDSEVFTIRVSSSNSAPSFPSTTSHDILASSLFSYNVNTNQGSDFDIDGDPITYTCSYDQILDERVTSGSACPTLAGLTFNTNTGVLNWTPTIIQRGQYEFKITGTDGALSSDTFIHVNVNPTFTLEASVASEIYHMVPNNNLIDMRNANTGDDTSDLGNAITYTCTLLTEILGVLVENDCGVASVGANFIPAEGKLHWGASASDIGDHFIRITANDGTYTASKTFPIKVRESLVFEWTATAGQTLTLPTYTSAPPFTLADDYYVDFGNSNSTRNTSSSSVYSSLYPSAGTYTVVIAGRFEALNFSQHPQSCLALTRIISLGDTGLKSMTNAFKDCTNLTDIEGGNTALVEDFQSVFENTDINNTFDISSWDTSSATNMNYMFRNALSIQPDVAHFNTANVVSMEGMFENSDFDVDVSSWDVSSVRNFKSMFANNSLVIPSVQNWNTESAEYMDAMFMDAVSLNGLTQDLSNWDLTSIISMSDFYTNVTPHEATFESLFEAADLSGKTDVPLGIGTFVAPPGSTSETFYNLLIGKGWLMNGAAIP